MSGPATTAGKGPRLQNQALRGHDDSDHAGARADAIEDEQEQEQE